MTNKEIDVVIKRALEINEQDEKIKCIQNILGETLTRYDDEEEAEQAYCLNIAPTLIDKNGKILRDLPFQALLYVSANDLEALIEEIRFKAECLRQALKAWIYVTETGEDHDNESDDEPIRYSITEDRP